MYTIEKEQHLQTTAKAAWNFLSNPSNLNMITPEDLDFQIISDIPPIMHNGLLIEYRIAIPFFGKQPWVTEIKHIREFHSFVDEQRLGPYSFWYHYHEIRDHGNTVTLIDRVCYEVPYGLIGKTIHSVFIRKTLERIFAFRRKKISALLEGSPENEISVPLPTR